MKKLNIGVLGSANIAQRSIVPGILELSELYNFIGIASRTETIACNLAKKFNCKPFFSYQQLIEEEILDAIYIPLPNALHYEWVKKSLQKGLHVLVEKSLALSTFEVNELVALAKFKQLSLIENFQFRFHPQLIKIKDLVDKGVIGNLKYVRSSFEFPPFPDKLNIRYQKALGGGALLDAGAYPIKLSQIFLDGELTVSASNLISKQDLEVDIGGGAYIQQDQGEIFSQISFGFENYYKCDVELFGSIGKISTNRVFTAPPGYSPEILILINGKPNELISVPKTNHFVKMLEYFYKTTNCAKLREEEYQANRMQSELIKQVYEQAQ